MGRFSPRAVGGRPARGISFYIFGTAVSYVQDPRRWHDAMKTEAKEQNT